MTYLKSRIEIQKPELTYNLHIKNDHNYLANGIVAANCHQAKATVLKNLMTGPFANCPIRWGLTGTIPKEDYDFYSILLSIGPVVNKIRAKELQDKDVLAKCHVQVVQINDFGEYRTYQDELKYLSNDKTRLEKISHLIESVAETGNTLVLVQRVQSGKTLTELINESVFIHGEVKSAERKTEYNSIGSENNKIIIATYGVAAVGINIPRIFNLVLIEPGKSFVRVIQSIGRGLRKAKDKDYVQIWDITSSLKYSKRHLSQRKKYYRDAEYPFDIKKIGLNDL